MNVTGYCFSPAQFAIAAYFTAVPSRTRLPLFLRSHAPFSGRRCPCGAVPTRPARSRTAPCPGLGRCLLLSSPICAGVISWTPMLLATSAIDRSESRCRLTAWSLYSWVKCRRVATRSPPLGDQRQLPRVSTRSGTVHIRLPRVARRSSRNLVRTGPSASSLRRALEMSVVSVIPRRRACSRAARIRSSLRFTVFFTAQPYITGHTAHTKTGFSDTPWHRPACRRPALSAT